MPLRVSADSDLAGIPLYRRKAYSQLPHTTIQLHMPLETIYIARHGFRQGFNVPKSGWRTERRA